MNPPVKGKTVGVILRDKNAKLYVEIRQALKEKRVVLIRGLKQSPRKDR